MDPAASPPVATRRVYEAASAQDGCRVLVDRLWPRGLRRDAAAIDLWMKDIAPSPALRRWFGHDPARWREFAERYRAELDACEAGVRRLALLARAHGRLTLLYAARDPVHNHAAVLCEYLREAPGGVSPGRPEAGLLARLRAEHARMLGLVDEARLALVRGDAGAARDACECLAQLHRGHAALEESMLLPGLPRAARWPSRTYEAEHAKAAHTLCELQQRLAAAPAHLRGARQRLQLIDAALPLRHVLEHHFAREEQGLFAELGAA